MFSTAHRLFASSHPGPTVAVTVLAVVLASAVGVEPLRTLLLALVVFVGQLSIGWSNDWLDARRDRRSGRLDKPVARGDLSVGTVRLAALLAGAASIPLSFTLGWAAAAAHLLFLACGWAYNLHLKATAWSVVPFIIGFGALPAVVTFAAIPPIPPAGWTLAVGGLFGIAIHFTNALPDLDDDLRTGVRGLPHRLGARTAGRAAFGALGVAGVVAVLGQSGVFTGRLAAPPLVGLIGCAGVLGLVIWGLVLVGSRQPDRLLFRLIISAALLVTVVLAVSGTNLGVVSTS
ncbi:UbiA family prenyltransferase [Plantibacter sp. ME-Dv--P-095]|uniref:UbiA family prenyltransferase n=1 Tax=Plantibacter sp. ME-Dv--P-095 TaxID=3040299 RepID=UPI00254F98CA|nr:UbiA family prenyltransferase [Plantibacter sp. ME-Dv--P-095]